MEKFGIIGDPVKGSRSPAIFRAGYGGKYPYDLIEGSDFEASWQRFLSEYKAVNVTAPFKEKAFAKVLTLAGEGKGDVSGPCMKIRATNLLVKTDRGIEAHNSDFTGIVLSIAEALYPGIVNEFYSRFGPRAYVKIHQYFRQNLPNLYDRRPLALIVGCGGAGKAAAVAAAELGYLTNLMNRTPERAADIAESLPEYGFLNVPMSDFREAVRECDLVIYTVPTAIDTISTLTAEDFRGEDRKGIDRPGKVILEANYKTPSFGTGETALRMQEGGCQYVPGRRWHLYQALTGYSLMTGVQPDFDAMQAESSKG